MKAVWPCTVGSDLKVLTNSVQKRLEFIVSNIACIFIFANRIPPRKPMAQTVGCSFAWYDVDFVTALQVVLVCVIHVIAWCLSNAKFSVQLYTGT